MDKIKEYGLLAQIYLDQEESNSKGFKAYGSQIKDADFFEVEKSKLIAKFNTDSIEDDIFVLCNPDELM